MPKVPSNIELQIARTAIGLGEIWIKHSLEGKGFEPSYDFFGICEFKKYASASAAPEQPGIYLIYVSESRKFNFETSSCLYVGRSMNLRTRLGVHWNTWLKGTVVDFGSFALFCKIYNKKGKSRSAFSRDVAFSECLMIGLLRPSFNFKAKD